jgi:CRISP-associated protein Cas1
MSTRWRVIDLMGHSGPLTAGSGRIRAGDQEYPLADVTCILTGDKTQWTGQVVAVTSRYGVPVISCDWRGVPYAATLPWSSNTRVAARHHAQACLSLPRKKNAWMRIVKAKVMGQAANLNPGPKQDTLVNFARQVRSGDPSNVEAQAAKQYWQSVFADPGFRRDRLRSDRNSLLNYGYVLLRGVVIRGIVTAGLSPTLGIHHVNRSNAFALADDLIEPFRPAIDATVKSLPPEASLSEGATKRELVAALQQPMNLTGFTVQTEILNLASNLGRYVEGEVDVLTVPCWIPTGG